MIVITDSSIIVSALLTPSGSIAQIFKAKSRLQFIAPDFLLTEIKEHFDKIQANSPLTPKELKNEYNTLLTRISIISIKDIPRNKLEKAIDIVRDIDINDAFFVAINRHLGHKIWTTDRKLANGLKRKGYDICVNTTMLKSKLYKK